MPATFSCQALRAVRISTGMLRWAARQRRRTDRPSSAGRPRSSTTASKSSTSPRWWAVIPSRAHSTVCPAAVMARSNWSHSVGSSSTMRMRIPVLCFFLAPHFQHFAVHGIHLQLGHAPVVLQQAYLVNVAAVVLVEIDLHCLALVVALHLFEHGAQGLHLALHQGLSGLVVVAVGMQQGGGTRQTQRQGARQQAAMEGSGGQVHGLVCIALPMNRR